MIVLLGNLAVRSGLCPGVYPGLWISLALLSSGLAAMVFTLPFSFSMMRIASCRLCSELYDRLLWRLGVKLVGLIQFGVLFGVIAQLTLFLDIWFFYVLFKKRPRLLKSKRVPLLHRVGRSIRLGALLTRAFFA